MKKIFLLAVVGLFLISFIFSFSALAEIQKPPFKTLKITYRITDQRLDAEGKPISETPGEKVVYIDAVNNRSRTELSPTLINIMDGKKLYTIDPKAKTALCAEVPVVKKDGVSGPNVLIQLRPQDAKFLIGSEEILGKKCDVYSYSNGTKIWLWNGVMLKDDGKTGKSYFAEEAVKIEEDITISEDMFKVPSDITVKGLGMSVGQMLGKINYAPTEQKEAEKPTSPYDKYNKLPSFSEREDALSAGIKKELEEARNKDGTVDANKARAAIVKLQNITNIAFCMGMLQSIQEAKHFWAYDNHKSVDSTPTWEDLFPKYMKLKPICRSGGTYTIGKVNEAATCSIKEHNLTDDEVKKINENYSWMNIQ